MDNLQIDKSAFLLYTKGMQKNEFYNLLLNTSFEIFMCKSNTVGPNYEKVSTFKNNALFYDWNSNNVKPLKDLFQHRIYYVIDGNGTVETTHGTLLLESGYAYYLPPGSILSTYCDDYMNHFYLHFKAKSSIPDILDLFNLKSVVKNPNIEFYFNSIADALQDATFGSAFRAQGLLQVLLSYFMSDVQLDPNIFRFIEILKYLNANFHNKITLQSLAEIMHLDPRYFSNLFTQVFGIPPIKYLQNIRLSEAQSLLMNPNLSISQVAETCGYDDQLYFSRIFKKEVGIPPAEYRHNMSTKVKSFPQKL